MASLNFDLINYIIKNKHQDDLFKGQFGLEKENVRVDKEGNLALTAHPIAFGNKLENPYITTGFF